MSFLAGQVTAILGAKVNPSGFVAYDAAMNKAVASAARAERAQGAAAVATARAGTASGKAAQQAQALATTMGAGTQAATRFGAASRVGGASVLALAGGLAASVAGAAGFQKQMSELQAVTGASSKQMSQFAKAAKDMGAKTGVGASAAAEALTELAKGGLSVSDILGGGFIGTLNLAQAGSMQLADAGQAVVKTLAQFQLGGSKATHVADALASAANATSMDVSDFTQALAQGGAAASSAGLSFDDTINVMASMANKFQSGSDLGTSLKTTLVSLAHPSTQAATELKRLGIEAFQANGKIKDAADLTKLLGDKFQQMTPKQRLASAAIIAGTDGMRTLVALSQGAAGNIIKQGSAAQVAAGKTNNLAGSWNRFKASIQNIAIDAGGPLLGPLADGLDALRGNLKAAGVGVAAFAGVSGLGRLVTMVGRLRAVGSGNVLAGLMTAVRANPWTAAAAGAAALGFVLVKMAGQEDAATAATHRHAQAVRDLKSALDDLEGKVADDAAATDAQTSADKKAAASRRAAADAARKYGTDSDQARAARKAAIADTVAQTRAHTEATTALNERIKKEEEVVSKARVEQASTRKDIQDQMVLSRPAFPSKGGGAAPKGVAFTPSPAAAERLADANRRLALANAQVGLSETNKQRILAGGQQIARKNAVDAFALAGALKSLPKEQRTKIMVEGTSQALADAGAVIAKVKSAPLRKQIQMVLAGSEPVAVKLAHVTALAAGKSTKVINTILNGDQPVALKIAALGALAKNVPAAKIEAILSGDGSVRARLSDLHAAAVNASAVTTITTVFKQIGDVFKGPKKAQGRGPGGAEAALVGEGRHAREAVVDPSSGFAAIVDRPTVIGLSPSAYVIPEDPMQRGRSMGLLSMLAGDLGLRGFAKGKDPDRRKGPKASKTQSVWASRPLPKTVDPTTLPVEELNARVSNAETDAGKWRDQVVSRKEQLTNARKKKKGVAAAERNLAQARKSAREADAWLRLQKKLAAQAQRYQDQITVATSLANASGTDMKNANDRHDGPAYDAAKVTRIDRLKKLQALVQAAYTALKVKGGVSGAALTEQLASLAGDLQEANSSSFDTTTDSTFSKAEQLKLDELDRDAALAALTAPTADDVSAAQARESFLSGLLGTAQGAGRPASVVGELAAMVKQARDDAKSFTQDTSPDQQAIIDQQRGIIDLATKNAAANAQALAVFTGSGDIGSGGGNAWGAAQPQIVQNINTLHPGSPDTLAAIAAAANAGNSLQNGIASSRLRVG